MDYWVRYPMGPGSDEDSEPQFRSKIEMFPSYNTFLFGGSD